MIQEDKRVKCINNKKNKGTLYSRCIGTLKAKGKYIFPLDNDDFFFDESLFYFTIFHKYKNELFYFYYLQFRLIIKYGKRYY